MASPKTGSSACAIDASGHSLCAQTPWCTVRAPSRHLRAAPASPENAPHLYLHASRHRCASAHVDDAIRTLQWFRAAVRSEIARGIRRLEASRYGAADARLPPSSCGRNLRTLSSIIMSQAGHSWRNVLRLHTEAVTGWQSDDARVARDRARSIVALEILRKK